MSDFNFNQMEAVIREKIDPLIRKQFEQSSTLYDAFGRSQVDLHPWTKPDGLAAYTQLMRGELELPHCVRFMATDCSDCRTMFRRQVSILRSVGMLAKHSYLYYAGSRNHLISQRLRQLAAQGTV